MDTYVVVNQALSKTFAPLITFVKVNSIEAEPRDNSVFRYQRMHDEVTRLS
jgi:hypothetical protein